MSQHSLKELFSLSEMFEPKRAAIQSDQEILSSLASVTTASFAVEFVPVNFSASGTKPAPGKTLRAESNPATFVSSRKEYQAALADTRITQALAQLQILRQRGQSPTPRIVGGHSRPQEFSLLPPAKIHPPRKPHG
jgi:hypothetical protein